MSDAFGLPSQSEIAPLSNESPHRGITSLKRNAVSNLLGQAAPLLVALFALPALTSGLGPDRFGVLTLAWAILGYFSLFDLGLGRAVTKLVAEKIGSKEEKTIPTLVWTSLILMSAFGLLGTLAALAMSSWLVHDVLRIPVTLQAESRSSFYLLALSIPIVTGTVCFRGILEAAQRFDLINLVRIPLGAFTFLGPLAVLPFTRNLVPLIAVLLLGRVLAWVAHLLLCFRVLPDLRSQPKPNRAAIGPLLRFGSWITVSNLISPLMVSLDRFIIGAMISVSAVAYYTAPYETVTKLWMIPAALTGVLFPAFASAWIQEQERAAHLFIQGVKYTFLFIFPVTLVIIALGQEGLALWLGQDYAERSARVLQWLAIGVLFNCLAQIPSALIQAVGRPDLTAKLHLLELPCYLVSLWGLIRALGIQGAAIAWTGRCFIDCLALFIVARRIVSVPKLPLVGSVVALMAAVCSLPIIVPHVNLPVRAVLLAVGMLLFGLVAWFGLLSPRERSLWRAYARL